MTHVAVAIVGFRNPDDISRCLEALEALTYDDFEVIVCENGGAEAFAALQAVTPQRLKGGQAVRAVMAPSNLGYGGGVNVCLRETPDADAWWVLNPDTHPYPEALAIQVARLERGDCDAVGCTLHLPNGKVQSHGGLWRRWLARPISIGHSSDLALAVDQATIEARQNYLNGASMLIGRSFLETTGPMREEYFLYCEEVEWCLRAVSRGMRLGYAPGALVLHYQGTTTGNVVEIRKKQGGPLYLNERNKMLLTRDLYPALLPVAALAALLLALIRYGRARAWPQLGWVLKGWAAGLRNERGAGPWG